MDAAATLRPGHSPVDAIEPDAWTNEVRDALLDVRWRPSTHRGHCRLERLTSDGVVVKLESAGRRRRDLLVTAHAVDGITYGGALRDQMARKT